MLQKIADQLVDGLIEAQLVERKPENIKFNIEEGEQRQQR